VRLTSLFPADPNASPPYQVGKLKSEVDLLRRKLADAAGNAPSEEEKAQLRLYRSQARAPRGVLQPAGDMSQLYIRGGAH
jgi:hypothetical protein